MRIGVYGDSFCDSHETARKIAWYTILPEYIPNSTLKNYGRGGTSVYYSYTKFLETYQEFDKIIFIVTNPDRYPKLVELSTMTVQFPNIKSCDRFLNEKDKLSATDIRMIEDIKGWFMASDFDYNLQMSELMIRDMERLHDNIIFYPTSPFSFTEERKKITGIDINLSEMQKRQGDLLGIKKLYRMREDPYNIACHLTEEFNLFVSKLFANKINNNIWDWSEFDNIELLHEITHYFPEENEGWRQIIS